MTLGFSAHRRRRRRRFLWGVARALLALALLGAAGVYAYTLGSRLSAARIDTLDREVASLSSQVADATSANQALTAELAAERGKLADLQQRYERDVPAGALRDTYALIGDKLKGGLTADRLQALIQAAEPTKACDAQITRKRLVVTTLPGTRTEGAAGFADGSLVLSVSGEVARNAAGQPEQWFDPARAVIVRITRPGGRNEQWTGPLPQHPLVVLGGDEYRFSVSADARGLVQVAMQRCRSR